TLGVRVPGSMLRVLRGPYRARKGQAQGGRSRAGKPDTMEVMLTFRWCLEQGVDTRHHYLWGTLLAGRNAAVLGIRRVAVIEFGVAGGNGLIALEKAAAVATELTGVDVEIFGVDTG